MSPRVTRRSALLGGGAVAGLAVLGGVLAIPNEIGAVRNILYRLLPDLRMDAVDETDFVEEFLAFYRRTSRSGGENSIRMVRALDVVPSGLQPYLPQSVRWARAGFEREVLRMFLLSTDYLDVRTEPGRDVAFIVIADPYVAGCANPWAEFDSA